jgi:AraC-like DNA-binding protein
VNKLFFSDNFSFSNINQKKKYHYTDARSGCPSYFLAYMVSGHAKIVSQEKTIYIKEGDVFYIPKGLPYQSYWYNNGYGLSWLSFGFDHLSTSENTNFALQVIPCPDSVITKIKALPTTGTFVTCKILSQFYDIMADILPYMQTVSTNRGQQIVENVQKYIAEHPECSIPDAARACRISEPYLYSLFRSIADTTPNEYRQQILCQKGIELLYTTDKTVAEISSMLNFSSESYFRKVLMKHTGYTPKEIRKLRKL